MIYSLYSHVACPLQPFQRSGVVRVARLVKRATGANNRLDNPSNCNTESNFHSRLLQRIESHVMLDKVCKRTSKEKPVLPIFTIHDSIATTEGNEHHVAPVVKEEMQKAIGLHCT